MSDETDERLAGLITRLEARLNLLDRLDERIARNDSTASQLAATERHLATIAWTLAATRFMASWIPGAVAGAVAGGIVAMILLGARVVGAH
jgi:hypothetical protein